MADTNVDMRAVPTAAKSTINSADLGPHYDEDFNELNADSDEALGEDIEGEERPIVRKPNKSSESSDAAASDEDSDEESEKSAEEDEGEEESDEDDRKPDIPFDRPSIKDIKAKYPDFFKEFPQMRESFFREIEFTKFFPSIEDAKEAFEDNEAFTVLSDAVLAGDPTPLLESIEKTDKKALEIFTASFLPALYKRDSAMYSQVMTPVMQNLVRQIYNSRDENTQNAALVLADFLFGDDGEAVATGKKSLAKNFQVTEEQQKLKDQKEAQVAVKFRESYTQIDTSIRQSLQSIILKDFDPNKVFTPFLKKQGVNEVIDRIYRQLDADVGHKQVMAARWKRAKSNGYSEEDKSKIVATFLARAKSLIPHTREKVRSAMLGTERRVADKKRDQVRPAPRETNSGRASNGRPNGTAKVDYSKMSDLDILNS